MLYRVEAGQSIQNAINAASPGDTVLVGPGIFVERLVIPDDREGLRLIAEQPGDTLLEGEGIDNAPGIHLAGCDFVTLYGFVITGFSMGGIAIEASYCNVFGNTVTASGGPGIEVSGVANLVHDNSVRDHAGPGICVRRGPGNFVIGCRATGNIEGGVQIAAEAPNTLVLDNLVSENDRGVDVAGEGSWILGNRIQGNRVGIVATAPHLLIHGNISLGNVEDGMAFDAPGLVTVRNRMLNNGMNGITCRVGWMDHADDQTGPYLDAESEPEARSDRQPAANLFYANQLRYNLASGMLAWLEQSLIVGTAAQGNRGVGLNLMGTQRCRVLHNVMERNGDVALQVGHDSAQNLIDHNVATGHQGVGIRVDASAVHNLVRSNVMLQNDDWDIVAESEADVRNAFHLNSSGKRMPDHLE